MSHKSTLTRETAPAVSRAQSDKLSPALPAAIPQARPLLLPGHKPLSRWPLVLIGIDKLVKAIGLVIISFVMRALLAPEKHQEVLDWINRSRLEPHNMFIHYVFDLAEKGMGIPPHTLQNLRLGVIIYAGLYLIEGIGLMKDWKWAEWLVVVTTALFLPLEMYEIWREVTVGRCLLFLANLAILGYLCFRLKRRAEEKI